MMCQFLPIGCIVDFSEVFVTARQCKQCKGISLNLSAGGKTVHQDDGNVHSFLEANAENPICIAHPFQ